MSGKLFDRYGAILDEDVEVLEACMKKIGESRMIGPGGGSYAPIRICEIGMHDGATAKGIESFWKQRLYFTLEYYGIDPDDGTKRPRYTPQGATVIVGDSCEVFNQVPDGLDLLWVDGCHCFNHVVLDTLHYAPKVRVGGFICFHDVNPKGQGTEHQYHGPDIPEFGLAVNQALTAIQFPWTGWQLFMERIPTEVQNCGTRAYRRIA